MSSPSSGRRTRRGAPLAPPKPRDRLSVPRPNREAPDEIVEVVRGDALRPACRVLIAGQRLAGVEGRITPGPEQPPGVHDPCPRTPQEEHRVERVSGPVFDPGTGG